MRIFSGIQPTGVLHLGNYFGAIRQWVELQEGNECIYCIVDYHALTNEDTEPDVLRKARRELALDLIACGIDPERTILFVQSDIAEHTELCWILGCVTSYGDLTRMTQFKQKAAEQEFVNGGLFYYPVLQAADILLYLADHVPVGEDQLQHLELSRRIARRFNYRFGELFPEPQPILGKGARIMSLADPSRKMSKSYGPEHFVALGSGLAMTHSHGDLNLLWAEGSTSDVAGGMLGLWRSRCGWSSPGGHFIPSLPGGAPGQPACWGMTAGGFLGGEGFVNELGLLLR